MLRATMEFARRGASRCEISKIRLVIGLSPTADRPLCHECGVSSHSVCGVGLLLSFRVCVRVRNVSGCVTADVVAVERAIVVPDGPYDTCELVRECDSGFVAVRRARATERPRLELGERFAC